MLSSKDRNDDGDEEDKINIADEVVTMECRRRRRSAMIEIDGGLASIEV